MGTAFRQSERRAYQESYGSHKEALTGVKWEVRAGFVQGVFCSYGKWPLGHWHNTGGSDGAGCWYWTNSRANLCVTLANAYAHRQCHTDADPLGDT
jgi:hypothetical protein